VVQLALPVGAGPAQVHAWGGAARCAQGVLLVGSGSMTHNLAEFMGGGDGEGAPDPYVQAFSRWVETPCSATMCRPCSATGSLLRSPARAPHGRAFSAPVLCPGCGAAGLATQYLSREVMYGMLAMDALALQPVV
jgi:4,5-DOPA dioxygenase extradiol